MTVKGRRKIFNGDEDWSTDWGKLKNPRFNPSHWIKIIILKGTNGKGTRESIFLINNQEVNVPLVRLTGQREYWKVE